MTKKPPPVNLDVEIEAWLENLKEVVSGRGYRPWLELEFMRIMLEAEQARQKANSP